jgi:hypothetical protein
MRDLSTLTPGDVVDAYDMEFRFAGQHDGYAVLADDLSARLERGYTGDPRSGHVASVVDARAVQVLLVPALDLE